MADQIGICNQALLLLGDKKIQSLSEDTTEASMANAFYADARNFVLADLKPNFAKVRSATLTSTATNEFEYSYTAPLPSDCLKVLRLIDTGVYTPADFRVEGRALLTNFTGPRILYITSNVSLEAIMDSAFVLSLAAYLASSMAYGLTGKLELVKELREVTYLRCADDARALYGLESTSDVTTSDQLILGR